MSFGTAATRIGDWFDTGRDGKSKRMIVWCDTYDYDDYPEYTDLIGDALRAYVSKNNGQNMKRLMEVYDLTGDKAGQLGERRAFNY